jgi:hypothetical protein
MENTINHKRDGEEEVKDETISAIPGSVNSEPESDFEEENEVEDDTMNPVPASEIPEPDPDLPSRPPMGMVKKV